MVTQVLLLTAALATSGTIGSEIFIATVLRRVSQHCRQHMTNRVMTRPLELVNEPNRNSREVFFLYSIHVNNLICRGRLIYQLTEVVLLHHLVHKPN
jgi:hypothetical protein